MQNKLPTILIECISALLIFIFVYTAVSKLITHDSFVFTLSQSPLLTQYSVPLSWIIPLSEILVSCFLFVSRWRKTGLFLSALMMTAFTMYVSYMIAYTPQLPCSCGGVLKVLTWREHLLFNIFFTLLAFVGWLLTNKNKNFIAINRISRTPV
jgi:hypothetical protein